MAGFFGLFNYEKEGPGVSKNAPKKKTFFLFFETFFRHFWKFITVNLVYSLVCIPVISSGLANAGITNVTRSIAREKHSFGVSDFFETIKKNWKQALIVGIINLIVNLFLVYDFFSFYALESDTASSIGMGIALAIFLIFSIMSFYIWTLMITFDFTIKQLYKNSFKFVFINLKYNLLVFVILALCYGIYVGILFISGSYWPMALIIELFVYILTFPAFKFLMIQYCVFPPIKKCIIDPYYEEHPEADIQRRRDLGLDIPDEDNGEEDEEEKENVFED